MRIGRTLPPAAAPLSLGDIFSGLKGCLHGNRAEKEARQELQEYFHKKHCFLVSSGKAALTLILRALKEMHPGRDQVLMPAFACYSVPSAIVRAGLGIQLCDIDGTTLDYDFAQLEAKLSNPRLLCVISVHLFGLPADVDKLRELPKDPAVTIIEDAAQAMGGEWQGQKLGTRGDVGFFSLGRGKALTAVAGGIILTDNEPLAKAVNAQVAALPAAGSIETATQIIYALALTFLLRPTLFWIPNSLPFLHLGETRFEPSFPLHRLSAFQAGLLSGLRTKIARLRCDRQANIQAWFDNLAGLMVRGIDKHEGRLPDLLRFPLGMGDAKVVERIVAQSNRLGLGLARTYPDAISSIEELRQQFTDQDFPHARRAAQELLTLPVHGFVSPRDRARIIRLLSDSGKIEERTV